MNAAQLWASHSYFPMDKDFRYNRSSLLRALNLMNQAYDGFSTKAWPADLPREGLGPDAALEALAPVVLGRATRLDTPTALAHMDPPTPWITWAATLWNASLNQNLLHPATGPAAREIETQVVGWLAPFFGMNGGHMTSGSSLANLTALWVARNRVGVREVIASELAHVSITKAANLLGLKLITLPSDVDGVLRAASLPRNLSTAALVLTAGTTTAGTVDTLGLSGRAAWTHVDAAWAGPLRLTRFADRLAGIEHADSVAVSAHKWLFQPKESALVFFRDTKASHAAIAFAGPYLTVPTIGVLGSHGATAVPLLATLLAWGRAGLASRVEHCMEIADQLAQFVERDSRLELFQRPVTGVVVWRPRDRERFDVIASRLPSSAVSIATIRGEKWFRAVAANPLADPQALILSIEIALKDQAP